MVGGERYLRLIEKAALDVGEMMVQEELMHSIDRTDAFSSSVNIDPSKFGVNGYQKGVFRFQKDEVEVGVAGLNSEFIFRARRETRRRWRTIFESAYWNCTAHF